jgi:rhodanese-related sulfurtransferase
MDAGGTLIDVRSPGEFAAGAIPGAVNIPLDDLRERYSEVPHGAVVHCQVGLRGHVAVTLLSNLDVETSNLDGGYLTWTHGQASQARSTA